jgi:fumarate hydratase subunit alpha
MKEISVRRIEEAVYEAVGKTACVYSPDILKALQKGKEEETDERSRTVMDLLMQNASIAGEERIPICQDTGLAIVWLHIGQDVHLIDGDVNEAVNRGVSRGYHDNYLRASSVSDPLFDRKNTGNNTPAVLYTEIVPGEDVTVEFMAKGFGSENKSMIKMLTPAEGIEGVKSFVLSVIKTAGPNACPPFVIGVGIGGTFDSCAVLSKRALLRPVSQSNPDPRYRKLEDDLLVMANELKIGPMGLHGSTTALKIQIEQAPTHIAGLPCAVNMCCHVCRHARTVIS